MGDDKIMITDIKDKKPQKRVNIEALLLMAKYDDDFKKRLFQDRGKALSDSEISFTAGEKLLLTNISDEQLAQNIEEIRIPGITKKSLPSWAKAAAVIVLLSSIIFTDIGCSVIKGTTPEPLHERRPQKKTADANPQLQPPPPIPPPRRQELIADDISEPRSSEPPVTEVLPPQPVEVAAVPPPEPEEKKLVELQKVYFEYDKSDITDEAKKILEDNADILKNEISGDILIEGYCDERGTEEYNMALGQRRADSVRKYLTALGIDEMRLTTISYGEEKPAVEGHNESAWKLNRRAVLKKINK